MANVMEMRPVGDDVPKVEGKVAVGEDLAFQQRWWRFERVIWSLFVLIVLADISGLLGRGPLSKSKIETADGSLELKYEHTERANTPSIMTITPSPAAVQDGKLRLHVSDSIVRELGAQRVIPQPVNSILGDGGVTYEFLATETPMTVQIALQPSFVGLHHFTLGVLGAAPVTGKVFVLP